MSKSKPGTFKMHKSNPFNTGTGVAPKVTATQRPGAKSRMPATRKPKAC